MRSMRMWAGFIMVRNETLFEQTGGRGYEDYGPDDHTIRLIGDQAATMCHACHLPAAETHYVFEDGFRQ